MELVSSRSSRNVVAGSISSETTSSGQGFEMPLHYPRYTKTEYETMPEWRVDCLLKQYGLPTAGDVHHKRHFAMGAFVWPHHS